LPANIRLGRTVLKGASTLDYLPRMSTTKKKRFITSAPEENIGGTRAAATPEAGAGREGRALGQRKIELGFES
jgi:hypothetical protein